MQFILEYKINQDAFYSKIPAVLLHKNHYYLSKENNTMHLHLSRRVKYRRRPFRLSTWNKTCKANDKNSFVKERNKSKNVVFRVVCKTSNSREIKGMRDKTRKKLQLQAKFSPSRRRGPPGRTGLFKKFSYQTTFLCKNNPGYSSLAGKIDPEE